MTAFPHAPVLTRPEFPPGREPDMRPDWAAAVPLLTAIADRLTRILELAEASAVQGAARDRYTTEEVAALLGKRPRTPQKWCRDRQVNCIRLARDGTYRLTRQEVERLRNHGLLPPGAGVVTDE